MNRVLIVEDDDAVALILEKRMQQRKFTTIRAHDAKQAVEMFRNHPDIVLVLSDYDMGGIHLNGDALYDAIREDLKSREIPFVVISAVQPQIVAEKFNAYKVPIIEKWKLNKEFDLVVSPLLKKPVDA